MYMPPGLDAEMRALVLATDAFGGVGGIAKYNRDLLTAMCSYPAMEEVTALPRLQPLPLEPLPPSLRFDRSALGGKGRFLTAVGRHLLSPSKVDLVVCGHINLLPPAYLTSRRFGAPLYLMAHGFEVWTPSPSRLANRLLRHVDGVICVSETTAGRLRSWADFDGPIRVVHNAVDLRAFEDRTADRALVERYQLADKTVLMTFGRMPAWERMKGFDEVIDLLPRLLQKIPNLVYLVVGDGDDRGRLEQKVRARGLDGAVIFTGYISEQEKAAHYRAAHAYVMPSRGEGFGFVFLEAMACGVPVVASKLDGGREAVMQGRLGTLVDPRDPDDLERGILEALAKPRGVPEGLSYFYFQNFEQRVHDWLAAAT